ncbi:hypothetical protein SLEP1_g19328 [Rubroshorea leprosula]|nr:hypothetical protein SLEP1_g19328 [Rubroshorea leprosula]
MPTFQSKSKEFESWSMDSDMEEHELEKAGDNEKIEIRTPMTEVEDDDVAKLTQEDNKSPRTQDRGKDEGSVQEVGDSLEEIQNLIDVEGRERAKGLMQKQGERQLSAGFEEDNRVHLSCKENPKEKIYKEPIVRLDSPVLEEATNMGLAQLSTTGNTKSAKKEEESKNRGSAGENVEEEGEDPFWKGFKSEEGRLKEWMGRKIVRNPKRKKRRIRSCKVMYLKPKAIGEETQRRKGQGRQSKQKTKEWTSSESISCSDGQAIDASVGDSEIRNCLGRVGKKRQIRDIVRKEKVEFLALQEIKMEKVDRNVCRRLWGIDDHKWIMKPSEGLSGGLLCIWSSKVFKMKKVLEGRNYIGVFGLWGEKEIPVYIMNIYCPCLLMGKRALWEELQTMVTSCKGNWCLMRDFNAVRRTIERAGCKGVLREMNDLDCFIHESGLVDLPLIDRKYTWYNSNGQHMSRIDKFVLSEDWVMNWSDVKQWGLSRIMLDHYVILLKNEMVDWGPKHFKFFDAWLEQSGCTEVIKNAWNSSGRKGWKCFRFKEKLKGTKKALKEWSGNSTTEVDSKIKEAEKEITSLDEKGEKAQLSASDVKNRRNYFLELWKYQKIKDNMWQQKSRILWLKERDANTKFSHKCVKGRWRRNEINSLQINEEQWQRPKLEGIDLKQISHTDSELFTAKFSKEEIKQVVWDCESSKSLGPNGFNFKFVKVMWEDIKVDIGGFLQEFHKHEGLNGLVSSAMGKELYKGVMVGNGAILVSHLQCVDDTIFFEEASEDNIKAVKCIMRIFELVSGLKINFEKSQLMGVGVEEDWREKMAIRLCCKVGDFPFKYLGIPTGGNHRRLTM